MSVSLFLRKRRVLLAIFGCSLTYFIIATYKQLNGQITEEEEDVVSAVRIEDILKTIKPVDDDHGGYPRQRPGSSLSVAAEVPSFIKQRHPQQHLAARVSGNNGKGQRRKENGKQSNDNPPFDRNRLVVAKPNQHHQPPPSSHALNLSDPAYTCRNSVQGRAYIADDNGYICDRFDLQVNGCCKLDAPSTKRYKCDTCSPSGCCAIYEQCVSCCLHPQKVYLLRKVLEKKASNVNRVYSLITDHFDLCLTKCRTSSESVRHENSYIDAQLKYCYGSADAGIDAFAVNKNKSPAPRVHL